MSNLKFKEPLSWTVPADKMVIRGRLDAEHFQPKFDELLERIASDGLALPLAELASVIRRGKQPRYVDDGEILVINSRHVGHQLINVDEAERTDREFWDDNPTARIKVGDVILNSTGLGSIGRANCVLHSAKSVVDNHVTIIRVDPKVIDPAYLAVFLNSRLGMMQTEQWLSGSSGQIELYPASIGKFLIRVPDIKRQHKIGTHVRDAYRARKSLMLLMQSAEDEVESLL
jgi:restriction endonuclease S subunit